MTSRRGQPWTEDDDAQLRELIDAGQTAARIAERLGRSKKAITLRRARENWHTKREPVTLTDEEKALLRAARFDDHGWALPDIPQAVAARLRQAHLIAHQYGRWYLRPRGFMARLDTGRTAKQRGADR